MVKKIIGNRLYIEEDGNEENEMSQSDDTDSNDDDIDYNNNEKRGDIGSAL